MGAVMSDAGRISADAETQFRDKAAYTANIMIIFAEHRTQPNIMVSLWQTTADQRIVLKPITG